MRLPGLLVCLILCLPATPSLAQGTYSSAMLNRPLRIEIPVSSDDETYQVIPCGDLGMVMFYKSIERAENNNPKWYFTLYDQNLQPVWTKSVPLEDEMEFAQSDASGDTLNLFFQSGHKTKDLQVGFRILRIIVGRGSFILNNGEMPPGSSLSLFRVARQKAFAGLRIRNGLAQLMIVDLPSGDISLFPVGGGSQTNFVSMELDPQTLRLTAIVKKQVNKKYWDHYLISAGIDGVAPNETLISTITPERELADCRIAPLAGQGILAIGTYVLTSSASDQPAQVTRATGFFASEFDGQNQKTLYFDNFLDLKSSGSILSEKDILSMRKKAMKKSHTNEEFSTDLNLVLHDIMKIKGQFILAGETFFPQYHTESFTDFDFYGRPFTNSYSVFDGYRFTNAIVAAFDERGQLLWDNSIDIRNLLTQDQDSRVCVFPSGNDLVMAYLSEGKIASKIIHEGTTVEKTDYSQVDLSDPNDQLVTESKSRMVPWYGNYFLCYGYQEIKNISAEGNPKKLVFYCNKIRFD